MKKESQLGWAERLGVSVFVIVSGLFIVMIWLGDGGFRASNPFTVWQALSLCKAGVLAAAVVYVPVKLMSWVAGR